jgi:hypothetical protein
LYFHLGGDVMVLKGNIIAIYDLDATTVSKDTRNFLSDAESRGIVQSVNDELPKSFVIAEADREMKVYLSSLSSVTLHKRLLSTPELKKEGKR